MDCPISQILAVMLAAAPMQAQDGEKTTVLKPAEHSVTQQAVTQRAVTQRAESRRVPQLAVTKREGTAAGYLVEIAAVFPEPH